MPQGKKKRGVISKPKPFSKFSPLEKDSAILKCIKVNVVAATDASIPLPIHDLFGFNVVPDTDCGGNIDIHCVEKYFNQTG